MKDQETLKEELENRSFADGLRCGILLTGVVGGKPEKFLEGLLSRGIPYHEAADLTQLTSKLLVVMEEPELAASLERSLEASLSNYVDRSDKHVE